MRVRRKLLYVGASLLFIGLTCLIVGGLFLKRVNYVEVSEARTDLSWKLSSNLTSKKTYLLLIESGDKWGDPFLHGGIEDPQPVNITITSPDGGFTRLLAFFYALKPTGQYYEEMNLAIVEVDYLSVDEGCLDVTEPSSQIRFTVKKDGYYNVSVLQQGLAETPPNWMAFYEEVIPDKDVYLNVVLSGGLMCVVGVIVFVWSITRRESIKHRGKHR
jgi:hypothetical protein